MSELDYERTWFRHELEGLARWAREQNAGNAFAAQVAMWADAHTADLDLPVEKRES
jgi:hypothetical protein